MVFLKPGLFFKKKSNTSQYFIIECNQKDFMITLQNIA